MLCARGIVADCVVWIVVARWSELGCILDFGCVMSGKKMVYAVLPRFYLEKLKYAESIIIFLISH